MDTYYQPETYIANLTEATADLAEAIRGGDLDAVDTISYKINKMTANMAVTRLNGEIELAGLCW